MLPQSGGLRRKSKICFETGSALLNKQKEALRYIIKRASFSVVFIILLYLRQYRTYAQLTPLLRICLHLFRQPSQISSAEE